MKTKQWENDKTCITYDEGQQELYFADRTDPFNEPRGYNQKVRGLKKAVEFLDKNFNNNYTMYGIITALDQFNLQIHTYCAMD